MKQLKICHFILETGVKLPLFNYEVYKIGNAISGKINVILKVKGKIFFLY